MIFTGDVAIAPGDKFHFQNFPPPAISKKWCLNLEGAITHTDLPIWGTANSSQWDASFKGFKLAPIFLGNNHIHDLKNGISISRKILIERGLIAFGAGEEDEAAAGKLELASDSVLTPYVLLGFGWPVIGCKLACKNRAGVNRLESHHVLSSVNRELNKNPAARIVVVMHTNYEFEPYMQPGHRRLARQLIDLGVYAVICHHSHIVGPVERYKGRPIAHSLGNWAFSYGKFFGGRLKFPKSSFHQIAVELGEKSDFVHHARFHPPREVRYERTESIATANFSLRPDFEGMDDRAYLAWFKKNRVKRRGLPIYRDANASLTNWVRDQWVSIRQMLIDAAAKNGLKAMRRVA